jgi:hypothetical protein
MIQTTTPQIQKLPFPRKEFGPDRRLRDLAAHADEISDRGSALLDRWKNESIDRQWHPDQII